MDREREVRFARTLTTFRHNPLGSVRHAFPWNEGELSNSTGQRAWQKEILQHIGAHLQNPATRHQPCLVAISSGHGIGKSALTSMLICWAMTQPDAKCVVTSNTENQLRTKTWPELAKWHRLALNRLGTTSARPVSPPAIPNMKKRGVAT